MVRILNLFCVALMGLSILGLYHVSEKTRIAHMQLTQVSRKIAEASANISVLETEWQHVASPERIQQLAEARLGMSDTPSVQLSSFDQLPRRGDDAAPLNDNPVHNASAEAPAPALPAPIPVSDSPGM